MAKRSVIIEVSPSRLEVAWMQGGRTGASKQERLSAPAFTEDWRGVLGSLGPRLVSMVAELGAAGAEATILYSSPSACTGLFSCPLSAGRHQAARAARLALAEAADFPLSANPSDVVTLATDRPGGEIKAGQIHTLGLADSDASATSLAEWARLAGLRPVRLIPVEAVFIAAATEAALRLSGTQGTAVVLHVGDHGTVLAAATAGRLRFVRQLAVGVETFVGAMSSPASMEERIGPYNEPGAKLAFELGIPTRDQALQDGPGSQAAAILPAVQPILQRCIVDIKQSLRFGLDEQSRKQARLMGTGPGAAIPRLLHVIAEQADLKLEPLAKQAESPDTRSSAGAIAQWTAMRPLAVNLLPRALDLEITVKRLSRGMWVGFAAAGVLLASGAVLVRSDLAQERKENNALKARLEAVRHALELGSRVSEARTGLAATKVRIAARLGETTSWDAAMAMLAAQTPPTIKLTEATLSVVQGRPTCRLTGYTARLTQSEANTSLKAYLDALSAVPLVQSCRLGPTQWSQSTDGAARQSFEATLVLVAIPPQAGGTPSDLTSVTPGEEH